MPLRATPRLWPWTNLLRRIVLGRGSGGAVGEAGGEAAERELLHPEEVTRFAAPVFLDNQLLKVRSLAPNGPLGAHFSRLTGGQVRHGAVWRIRLKNALVHENGVSLNGRDVIKHRRGLPSAWQGGEIRRVPRASLAESGATRIWFGHWLRDGCTTALLAEENDRLLLPASPAWPDAAGYAALFGLDPAPPGPVLVEALSIYEDHAQGPSKRARMRTLRARLAAAVTPSEPGGRVYLRRGRGGAKRLILNEDALAQRLSDRGFRVVDHEGKTVDALAAELVGAAVGVGIEGSHLNHLQFTLAEDGFLLVLVPPDRFTLMHLDFAEAAGLRGGFVVLDGSLEDGFTVNVDDVMRTLDVGGIG
ncbi:MAG: glycosyltransferase family 61 protein [Pseudomonadota bacterium]